MSSSTCRCYIRVSRNEDDGVTGVSDESFEQLCGDGDIRFLLFMSPDAALDAFAHIAFDSKIDNLPFEPRKLHGDASCPEAFYEAQVPFYYSWVHLRQVVCRCGEVVDSL